jgi:hypothetical protein
MYNYGYPYYQTPPYYNSGYSNGNYAQPSSQPTVNQPSVNTNKLYAAGIEDVRCRPLPANSDYIFLDNDKPLIYRKTTDATGKMDIQVFKIMPYEEELKTEATVDMSMYVLRKDFDELKAEIASLKDSMKIEAPKSTTTKKAV